MDVTPEDRADRAVQKLELVAQQLGVASTSGQVDVRFERGDKPWLIHQVIVVRPELDLSSILFELGEALHHLRASLDNFAFERVVALGGPPRDPRSIKFPIVDDAAAWEKATRHLRVIPSDELDRWREVQPFRAQAPADSLIGILGRVQNVDKHREAVVPSAYPGWSGEISFRLGDIPFGARPDASGVDIDFAERPKLENGEVLTVYRFGRDVELLSQQTLKPGRLNWFIWDQAHGRLDLADLVQALRDSFPVALRYLRQGGVLPNLKQIRHETGRSGQLQFLRRGSAAFRADPWEYVLRQTFD